MEEEFITFYFYWLELGQTAFYILLYIRLFAEDKKTLKCNVTQIKEYFNLSDTNKTMYEEIEKLKELQYISYIKGKRQKDYTLIINEDYMQMLVDRDIRAIDHNFEMLDRYINIESYRKTLMITRVRKENIDVIFHFNKDKNGKKINKNIVSVKPIVPIKLYIYSCGYNGNFKSYDYTTYASLSFIFTETENTIKNASTFLSQCPLVMQKYCKQIIRNKKKEEEQEKRIKEGKQKKSEYIRPLGTVHYIIDTAF